jgi:NodT family efflux transporter outer membrane factor (OMF) lipoprotein
MSGQPLGRVLALAVAFATAGCAVPPGVVPETLAEVPSAWSRTPAPAAGDRAAGDRSASQRNPTPSEAAGPWWLAVDDPVLHRLIEQSGEMASVRIARERFVEAGASLRAARAALVPSITGLTGGSFAAPGDDAVRQSIRSAALGLEHDFDLAGVLGARAAGARALAEARAEAVDAARIAAREMVVRLYAAYAGATAQRQVTRRSVQAFEDVLAIADSRARAGLGPQVDVVQARAALAAARSTLPRLEAAREGARLGLEALLGLLPGALLVTLDGVVAVPAVDPSRPLRTPLEVVALRPDLRVAELELAAAAAGSLAALRDRWPRLTLGALLGVQSVRVPGPLAADGLVSSLVAGLAGPLFDAGRLEARADAARSRERVAAIAYRQAALAALSEVEEGLSGFAQADAEDALNAAAVDAAEERLALVRTRWRGGLSAFLEVVLAEQSLQAANAQRVASRMRMLETFARLSTAVGAGG